MKTVERKEYLNMLISWRDKQIIKVVSGVRRCGKSTLFKIYKDYLIDNGVSEDQIISVNFEDLDFESLNNYKALYDYICTRLVSDRMNYIFLDEIQHCKDFQKAVDSLFIKENCDVYLTGSNAYFMSGELATLLSGRYVEIKMLPLSFSEFYKGLSDKYSALSDYEKFNLYVEYGSFPFLLRYENFGTESKNYLNDIYNTILLNDIIKRLKINDSVALDSISKFLLHNIGNRVSSSKIANTMTSAGKKIDVKTVEKYLSGLVDSLLLYKAPRYNIKGKQFLSTNCKYYSVDTGLRNMLVKSSASDIGHILENIVFLELKRRYNEVYVGDVDNGEVDFVVIDGGNVEYYQVCASALDENTLTRELKPFYKLHDNYPKFLLTLDTVFSSVNIDGILKKNVVEWLLQK